MRRCLTGGMKTLPGAGIEAEHLLSRPSPVKTPRLPMMARYSSNSIGGVFIEYWVYYYYGGRFSRIRLSSQWALCRDSRADALAVVIVNSPSFAK
jgi:hypothetical protein